MQGWDISYLSATRRGLLQTHKPYEASDAPVVESYQWAVENSVCFVNGGGNVVFTGVIRGAEHHPISYVAPTVEEAVVGLELSEWVYYITVNGVKVADSNRPPEKGVA